MTIGWPRLSAMAGTMLRAVMSVPPPGAAGTISRIGRCGYCAAADAAASESARTANILVTLHLPFEEGAVYLLGALRGARPLARRADHLHLRPPVIAQAGDERG